MSVKPVRDHHDRSRGWDGGLCDTKIFFLDFVTNWFCRCLKRRYFHRGRCVWLLCCWFFLFCLFLRVKLFACWFMVHWESEFICLYYCVYYNGFTYLGCVTSDFFSSRLYYFHRDWGFINGVHPWLILKLKFIGNINSSSTFIRTIIATIIISSHDKLG